MPIKLRGCRWQWTIEHDASGEGVDDEADLRIWRPISHLPPVHASSSEWGVMRRFPLSSLLRIHNVDNVERCTATMQPLSTHIVVCRFAGPPSQRAMATLPVDSDFVVSSLPSTFGAASDLDWEKIETNQMRNREEDLIFGKPFTFAGGGDGA